MADGPRSHPGRILALEDTRLWVHGCDVQMGTGHGPCAPAERLAAGTRNGFKASRSGRENALRPVPQMHLLWLSLLHSSRDLIPHPHPYSSAGPGDHRGLWDPFSTL